MKEITIEAIDKNLENAQNFVREELSKFCSDGKILLQIDLVVEEVFVNISHYAYAPENGQVTIGCDVNQNSAKLTISFTDSGKPFNPLKKADPDITQTLDERSIGGLGIFLAKKYMSTAEYDYKDGKNIFTLTRNF